MESNGTKTNGWNEYKLLVLKQLEFLAAQTVELTKNLVNVDKEQAKSILKIDDINKNTAAANASLDKRLETMNEFREALKDQTAKYITREEYNLMNEKVVEDIKHLSESKAHAEGKASMTSVYISYAIAAIALGFSLLEYLRNL